VLGRAVAAEYEVGVAVDQAGGNPRTVQWHDFGGAEAGKFGALADADDLAVLDPDRGIALNAHRVAVGMDHSHGMAVDEEAVPHGGWH
jgi:hypothetical protein